MLERAYLEWLSELDLQIVQAAEDIKVLSRLTWPATVQQDFFRHLRSGRQALPEPTYNAFDLSDNRYRLASCMQQLEGDSEPLRRYLYATAESYHTLCLLIESIGSAELTDHSRALYGVPADPISSGHVNNLEAAKHFLEVSQQYRQSSVAQDNPVQLSAEALAEAMRPRLDEVFGPGVVRVDIDANMASKAAAGVSRIRIRAGAGFSECDLGQLLQHEGLVHSLTALNGSRQTRISALGLGAPRTTGAQEGLATFAELVTGVMDITRLERLALRVLGIQQALDGADFIEVFRFFLDAGVTELDSFTSSMRIFRGVPLTGGCAFTKDVVYLHGLMEVHTFFRWAMQHKKLAMCRHFFAGRMTVGDVVRLQDLFDDGVLDGPVFLPPWMVRTDGLAAYLAFSVFANRITVEELDEHHAFETPADLSL